MELNRIQKRTWAEIDLDALKYNFKKLRQITPSTAKICCTVKADAYGHGSVRIAKLYEDIGADYLAVSNIKEAITVRDSGVELPILILGYTDPECAEILAEKNIAQCVYSYEYGIALAEAAKKSNVRVVIHVKLDVGMGRLGFLLHDTTTACEKIAEIYNQDCFISEGIFTHFPMASEGDKDDGITQRQYDLFCGVIKSLEDKGIKFSIRHCCNSAAAIKYPEFSMDMVRYGIALYGASPSSDIVGLGLKNTISLKSVISNIKHIRKGDTISYGSEYVAAKDVTVATLPIGYDDGFRRENFVNGSKISVNGILCDIAGRVCMDQTMIDVSDVKDIRVGDVAVIYGSGSSIDVEGFSLNNKKIPYEVMCEISARVPRVYIKNETIESVRDSFV